MFQVEETASTEAQRWKSAGHVDGGKEPSVTRAGALGMEGKPGGGVLETSLTCSSEPVVKFSGILRASC